MKTLHERENYSWGLIQDMIEREISSAFKLREPTKMPSKKEMLYSHQNMARAINSFLPYLTNDDLTDLGQDILDLMNHREKKEAESKLEVEKHSWPYPDTKNQI